MCKYCKVGSCLIKWEIAIWILGIYTSSIRHFFLRSSFSSFASKWGKDSRFKGVEKMRDKEDIFNEYVQELEKKEKEERKERKEKVEIHLSF